MNSDPQLLCNSPDLLLDCECRWSVCPSVCSSSLWVGICVALEWHSFACPLHDGESTITKMQLNASRPLLWTESCTQFINHSNQQWYNRQHFHPPSQLHSKGSSPKTRYLSDRFRVMIYLKSSLERFYLHFICVPATWRLNVYQPRDNDRRRRAELTMCWHRTLGASQRQLMLSVLGCWPTDDDKVRLGDTLLVLWAKKNDDRADGNN